jgi:hypothetical protein
MFVLQGMITMQYGPLVLIIVSSLTACGQRSLAGSVFILPLLIGCRKALRGLGKTFRRPTRRFVALEGLM